MRRCSSTSREPANLQELLALPYDEYITACWARAQKVQAFLGTDPTTILFMEAMWSRRYWLARNGQFEVEH